ncbi:HVO_0476 family zinc finger protein [Methanothermococcus sp. Ax23]|uniref:HVO_0476 family zinc finger protein n=1 Tax=Methanothermococcus sp. Ax23 TaxID=3156486 RepID=UPI003BA3C661
MDEELLFECPICDDITPHDILKRQESKKHIKLTVKCLNCGYVHEIEKTIKLKDVKVIISRYGESEKKVSQLPVDEVLKVGDIINIFGEDVEITSIETTKRVMSSKVEDIQTIWAKSLNIPKKVGISINDRDTTYSINILVPQDYVFDNETTYRVGRMFFKIKMIKTEKGTFKREIARKIKRIYANSSRPVRNYEDLTENIV